MAIMSRPLVPIRRADPLNSSEQILQDFEIDRLGKVMIKAAGFRLPAVFLLAPAGQGDQLISSNCGCSRMRRATS